MGAICNSFVRFGAVLLVICFAGCGTSGCARQTSLDADAETENKVQIEAIIETTGNLYHIQKKIIEFNVQSDEYYVNLTLIEDPDIYAAGFAANGSPDIYFFNPSDSGDYIIDPKNLSMQGALCNLYDYLYDEDSSVVVGDIPANLLSALQYDEDRLYVMPLAYSVDLMAGNKAVLDDRYHWTFNECVEYIRGSGFHGYLFGPNIPAATAAALLFMYNESDFIDWSAGTCDFTSEEFKTLLILCGEFAPVQPTGAETATPVLFSDGDQLLERQQLSSANSVQMMDQLVGGEAVFIGAPTVYASGNAFVINASVAISAVTEYPDAAWALICFLLDGENDYDGFPVMQKTLDEYLASGEDMTYRIDIGDVINGSLSSGDYSIIVSDTTPEDRERLGAVIRQVDHVLWSDRSIITILTEETEDYAAGRKSLDTAVRNIQSRVQLYLDEQYSGS